MDDRMAQVNAAIASDDDLAPRKAQGRQERQGRGASKSSMAGAAYTQAHHIPADIYRAFVIRYGLVDERKNDVMLAALVIMSGVDLKDAGVNDNVVRIVKLMRKRDDSQMEQMKDVMKRLAKARAEERRLLDQLEGMLNWLIGDRLGILNRSGMDADTFDMNESGAQDLLASARRSFEGFHAADKVHNERIGAGMVANRRAV